MAFCIYLWELQNATETRDAPKLVETRSARSYNTCVLVCLQSPEMMTSEEITAFLSVSGGRWETVFLLRRAGEVPGTGSSVRKAP